MGMNVKIVFTPKRGGTSEKAEILHVKKNTFHVETWTRSRWLLDRSRRFLFLLVKFLSLQKRTFEYIISIY